CRAGQGTGAEGAAGLPGPAGTGIERTAFGQRHETGAAAHGGGFWRLRRERDRAEQFSADANGRDPGESSAVRWRAARRAAGSIGIAVPLGESEDERFEGADRAGRAAGPRWAAVGG